MEKSTLATTESPRMYFGWWYIRNGQVDFGYTGTVTDGNRTYQVVNGNVNRQ